MLEHVKHPLIVPGAIEARAYQLALAESALKRSTMIVLPTGLGKTVVALLVISARLKQGARVLFLAPTKPLVEQHTDYLQSHLCAGATIFTGEISPKKRLELWQQPAQVIVSTPQVIENDLLSHRIDLSNVNLLIFDEAHRAVGNYAYVYIATKYLEQAQEPLILGLTASPGGTAEKIKAVSTALHIDNIEIRTEADPDVNPYIYRKDVEWYRFSLPSEMEFVRQNLQKALATRLRELKRMEVIPHEWISTSDLLKVRTNTAAAKNYRAMSLIAEVIKLRHAILMIETQGVSATNKYLTRLQKEAHSRSGSKAAKRLGTDPNVKQAMHRASTLDELHPKVLAVQQVVRDQLARKPNSRIIVFTNYRDTAELVKNVLRDVDGVRPVKFVGQAQKDGVKGLTQKEQVQLIAEFVEGTHNVLVATSVAEEGLDIPSTDMVLFYEPIPSEIRSIQREGRTGRRRAGKVVVLITKGTRDEAYYRSSTRKKNVMRAEMKRMSHPTDNSSSAALFDTDGTVADNVSMVTPTVNTNAGLVASDHVTLETECSYHDEAVDAETTELADVDGDDTLHDEFSPSAEAPQKTLLDFEAVPDTVKIVVDSREMRSRVVGEMEKLGALIEFRTLPIADYILSDKVAVERKTTKDFLSTLIERDLFGQIQELTNNYETPLLIIEGTDLYTKRNVHPNAIRGVLASIAVDFKVPILHAEDPEDTASLLYIIARREQIEAKREPMLHGKKATKTLKDQQEYLISSIPSIGPVAARALLQHFGSVEAIVRAPVNQLVRVKGIGKTTARKIRDIVSAKYVAEDT